MLPLLEKKLGDDKNSPTEFAPRKIRGTFSPRPPTRAPA